MTAYIKELQALDAWMRTEIMTVPAAKRGVNRDRR